MRSLRLSLAFGVAFLALGGSWVIYAQTPPKPALAPAASKPAIAPAAPERLETITYDSWTVSCRGPVDAAAWKTCSALLRVIDQNKQLLMAWIIGLDKDGKLTSVVRTPTGISVKDNTSGASSTGILVKNGLELKLGNSAARHLTYVACEPQWCEASIGMDEAFVKDALAAADATVTIYATDGRAIAYPSLPVKGIDKAISSVQH